MSTQPSSSAAPSKKAGTRSSSPVDIAYIAVFAAIICVLGFVSIPVGAAGVPIVLQNAAAILAGLVLGARRGPAAVAVFLLVGLALPVLAGSPTVGYLVGYLISAAVAGALAYAGLRGTKATRVGMFILAGYLGLFLQYLFGVFGLMFRADMTFGAAWAAQVPFLLPDAGKVALMITIALAVHAAFPDMRRR